ncbi:FYVE, RhoGEF and PH domain-containing protein 4-like isoform X1 [Clytia hemisphaerica]|uniref:FYVE, RhoGEF and PH domain-containing protein 4-like isoform X1 n=1 Tax=Clytia hemisphaerica TaxID=252671 RepID=UPI0034D4A1EA
MRFKEKSETTWFTSVSSQSGGNQGGTMEKARKRQKIARCMVRFNALNESRPRTDVGQPVLSEKRRCVTLYHPREPPELHRTASDPDLYRRSQENLAGPDPSDNGDHSGTEDEKFTEYTAVGSHEDIHALAKQISVQEILTNFEDKNHHGIRKPIPKPRKSIPSIFQELNTNKNGDTTTVANEQKSDDSDNGKTESHKSKRPKPPPRPPSEDKPNIRPDEKPTIATKPKVLPKPSSKPPSPPVPDTPSLDQNCVKEDQASDKREPATDKKEPATDTRESATTINIEYKVSGGVTPNNKDSKKDKTKLKQKSTKPKSFDSMPEAVPYEVVNICTPQPTSDDLYTEIPTGSKVYEDPEEEYLSPVDGNSSSPEPPETPPATSTNHYATPSNSGTTSKSSTLRQLKEKRQKFNKSKYSKSMVGGSDKKKPAYDPNRRRTVPDLPASLADEMGARDRRLSEQQEIPIYGNSDVVSPSPSDDECWNSDEFESTDDEDDADFSINDGDETQESGVTEEPIPKLPHLEGVKKKLYNIVTEILTTERAYVKRLFLLNQIFNKRFIEASKEDSNIITDKAVADIFPFLQPIYEFHTKTLLPAIEERIKDWEEKEQIGDIFLRLGAFLLLYQEYVKKFDNATSTLSHWLKKSPKFNTIVEELQKDPRSEHLSLQHHMLEPIQRVPRYKLLLADYLKRLPEDSNDQKDTRAALTIISKAAESSNNSMKENKKFTRLLEIEDRIVEGLREGLVLASREFLKEGELAKLAARSGNKNKRILILFNDMLLCCIQTPTGKLRVRQRLDLHHLCIMNEEPDLPENSFSIKGKQKVLDFQASDEDEMNEWMSSIRNAVHEFERKRGTYIEARMGEEEGSIVIGQQAPKWVKDDNVSMCMLCAFKFGLINRKHHCRGCGRVVCGKCSAYKAHLSYADALLRVCYSCAVKMGVASEKDKVNEKLNNNVGKRDSGSTSDMHGEMYWKAPNKEYKKQWIFLSNFALYIQKKRQDPKALQTLPVPGYTVDLHNQAEDSENPYPHYIKIHKNNKKEFSYYIASDNKESIKLWYNHLKCAINLETYKGQQNEDPKEEIEQPTPST